jgi:hypothetical protein
LIELAKTKLEEFTRFAVVTSNVRSIKQPRAEIDEQEAGEAEKARYHHANI